MIGYGTIASTGLTLFSGVTEPGAQFTSFTSARVFLDNAYDFSCDGASTFRDLQHVITHELLHALGIDHSADPTAVMAAVGTACELEPTLQPDDVADFVCNDGLKVPLIAGDAVARIVVPRK